jgi:hypothetical protein
VTRQKAKRESRVGTSEPVRKAAKVFTAAGELERKRKAEKGTTEQVAQLKKLVYRLLKSYDERMATQESQQKDLAATIKAQTKTFAKLEAAAHCQPKDKRTNSKRLGLSFNRTSQSASRIAMPYTESHCRQTALALPLRSSRKQCLREHR